MSAANETPRICANPVDYRCQLGCVGPCAYLTVTEVQQLRAELAAERAKHKADLELAFKDHDADVKDLATWQERAESAESRLKEALCDLANSRSGMVEANKRWTDALRELERVQTLLEEALAVIDGVLWFDWSCVGINALSAIDQMHNFRAKARAIATQEAG